MTPQLLVLGVASSHLCEQIWLLTVAAFEVEGRPLMPGGVLVPDSSLQDLLKVSLVSSSLDPSVLLRAAIPEDLLTQPLVTSSNSLVDWAYRKC
ncbi:hypothetical protein J3459_006548 [Metarhizium acridum]|nr:hypothetical protein J3459_006548 [Metarhizium acridum]